MSHFALLNDPVYTDWLHLLSLTYTLLGLDQLSWKKSEQLVWNWCLRPSDALKRNESLHCGEMLCQCFVVAVSPDEDDGLLVSLLWLRLFECSSHSSLPRQTVGGVQTRTITPFVLLYSPAIHRGNSTTHTHMQYQRVTFCWKNEAVSGSASSPVCQRICDHVCLFPCLCVTHVALSRMWWGVLGPTCFLSWKPAAVMQAGLSAPPPPCEPLNIWWEVLPLVQAAAAAETALCEHGVYRTKPQQASRRSCQGSCHSRGILQLYQITEGLSCRSEQQRENPPDGWDSVWLTQNLVKMRTLASRPSSFFLHLLLLVPWQRGASWVCQYIGQWSCGAPPKAKKKKHIYPSALHAYEGGGGRRERPSIQSVVTWRTQRLEYKWPRFGLCVCSSFTGDLISCAVTWIQEQKHIPPPPPAVCASLSCWPSLWGRLFDGDREKKACLFGCSRLCLHPAADTEVMSQAYSGDMEDLMSWHLFIEVWF